jgi:hypothetical protein
MIFDADLLLPMQDFLENHTFIVPGRKILFKDFCERFLQSQEVQHSWTKHKISAALQAFRRVRNCAGNRMYVMDASFDAPLSDEAKRIANRLAYIEVDDTTSFFMRCGESGVWRKITEDDLTTLLRSVGMTPDQIDETKRRRCNQPVRLQNILMNYGFTNDVS